MKRQVSKKQKQKRKPHSTPSRSSETKIPDPLTGRFLPGESGNPNGRPKSRKVTQALERLLELAPAKRKKYKPKDGYEEIAMGLLTSATKGDGKFRQRSHAQALIYDRIEGKPEPSDKEVEAVKRTRDIIFDMPTPPVVTPAPPKTAKVERPN